MDRHTSLLLLTYLSGFALGLTGALFALMSTDTPTLIQLNCIDTVCSPLNRAFPILSLALPGGAIIALLTTLLSRGLYRLFFTENKQT